MSHKPSIIETNALRWFMKENYRPVIGMFQKWPNIIMMPFDSDDLETFEIDDIVAQYREYKKELARARASEKRVMANTQHRLDNSFNNA